MNNIRNARQTEFLDMREFLKQRGHNDSSIAQAIGRTKAMVSKYVNDPTKIPPEGVLMLMRRVVKDLEAAAGQKYPERKESIAGMESDVMREIADKLNDIHDNDPKAFKFVSDVIGTVHRTAKNTKYPPAKRERPNSVLTSDSKGRAESGHVVSGKKA